MNELEKVKKENFELKQQLEKLKSERIEKQKQGMSNKASQGKPMSRPAYGYKFENGNLIPAENFREIQDIFEDFVNENLSLNFLAKKYKFSVNGIKKILNNFTYIGKIKFNGEIHQGKHQPIISNTLFNHAQNKISKIKKSSFT